MSNSNGTRRWQFKPLIKMGQNGGNLIKLMSACVKAYGQIAQNKKRYKTTTKRNFPFFHTYTPSYTPFMLINDNPPLICQLLTTHTHTLFTNFSIKNHEHWHSGNGSQQPRKRLRLNFRFQAQILQRQTQINSTQRNS